MKKSFFKQTGLKLALLFALALPELAGAQQFFSYNQFGDVLLGFRKTGSFAGTNELVVNLGSITNFLKMSAGTVSNINNFSPTQLTAAFSSGYGNLQWSASAAFPGSINPWITPVGTFPKDTVWYTQPAPSVSVQSQPPVRDSFSVQASTKNQINGMGGGAVSVSGFLGSTNSNNNLVLVREPTSFSTYIVTAFIGDVNNTAVGNFGANGTPLPYSVEITNPGSFTVPTRQDLYQLVPVNLVDPTTTLTNQTPYFIGFFTLSTTGTMTFTRASAATVPSAGAITSTLTNGFAPLTVIFTNTATGSITNWVWNFGNGTIITNTTGGNVTNTYAAGGTFTVILTVRGPGGSSSVTNTNFIVTSPKPTIKGFLAAGKFVISGTNFPIGVAYHIIATTNLTRPTNLWATVASGNFLGNATFNFTNSNPGTNFYYRLVSP